MTTRRNLTPQTEGWNIQAQIRGQAIWPIWPILARFPSGKLNSRRMEPCWIARADTDCLESRPEDDLTFAIVADLIISLANLGISFPRSLSPLRLEADEKPRLTVEIRY